MKKKNVRFLAGLLTAAMVLSMGGCGKKSDTESGTEQTEAETKTEKNDTANASDSADEAASTATGSNASADFSFADLQYVDFTFSSGAGAWETRLNIQADGSFSGEYWDMDMGSTGEGHPNGTQYGNTFTGTFTDLKKVNDYTWSMKLDKINYAYEIGKEEILDQILYSYTEAYGLDGADEVDIYVPGAPVDHLPEEFLQWACSNYDRFEAEENGLPCYGLYNVEGAEGFSGYDSVDTAKTYVENTEKAAKELEDSLQNDSLSQGDMNEKSQELYEDWDDALNQIWYHLKDKGVLGEDAMAKLLEEQRAWIKDKEAAVQEAGKEAEGGSLQPLLENTEAAKWTRERTYKLLNILLETAGRETVTME